MTNEKITIHQALCELKILDKRIPALIKDAKFVVENKHSNTKINGVSIEEAKNGFKASYDKIADLIKRRKAIKRAVTLSNAETEVTIQGMKLTIAEAIEYKNHGIEFEEDLLKHMSKQLKAAQDRCNYENGETLQGRADEYVLGMFGSKDGKAVTKEIEEAKANFIKANTFEIIEGFDTAEIISDLVDRIDKFKIDFDSAIGVSNAITEIEISY